MSKPTVPACDGQRTGKTVSELGGKTSKRSDTCKEIVEV